MPERRKPAMVIAAGLLALGTLPVIGALGPTTAQARPAQVALARSKPPVKFVPPKLKVPRASTAQGPALVALTLPAGGQETGLFWTEPPPAKSGSQIAYETSTNLSKDLWSPLGIVSGTGKPVLTTLRPSVTQLAAGKDPAVFVTWAGAADQRVWFTIGSVLKNGTLTWPQAPQFILGAYTSTGPTVFSPPHSSAVFLTWEAASNHQIDFVIGHLTGSTIKWGAITKIPGAETTAAPAVAEASTGKSAGRLYVFWRDRAGQIAGASTADPLASGALKWTTVPSKVGTGTGVAAAAIGKNGSFPLLLVYRAETGSALLFATLNATGALRHTSKDAVKILASEDAPALLPDVLAANDPGEIFFVRVCPGC